MQQENYSKLTRDQYLDLNVRIQKSLILDFDLGSAQESALEDWKIDVEREEVDKGVPIKEEEQQEEEEKQASELDAATNELNEQINGLEGIKEEEDGEAAAIEANVKTIKLPQSIEYERLSEFFFDLCLSWC